MEIQLKWEIHELWEYHWDILEILDKQSHQSNFTNKHLRSCQGVVGFDGDIV